MKKEPLGVCAMSGAGTAPVCRKCLVSIAGFHGLAAPVLLILSPTCHSVKIQLGQLGDGFGPDFFKWTFSLETPLYRSIEAPCF